MFKKTMLVGLLITLHSVSASAEDGSNFAGEVLIGKATQELSTGTFSSSADGVSFGVRAAYPLSESISFEAGYQLYTESDNSYVDDFGDDINDTLSSTAFNIGVKGSVPLENSLSLHARVGLAFWNAEIEETDSAFPGEIFKADDDGNDVYFGFGAQYDVNPSTAVSIEYTATSMGMSVSGVSADFDVKNISLAVSHKFQ